MVVFSLQDFVDMGSVVESESSSDVMVQNTEEQALLSPVAPRAVIGYLARSTQSAFARAWALPSMLPGANFIGAVGASLFTTAEPRTSRTSYLTARSSGARPSRVSRP